MSNEIVKKDESSITFNGRRTRSTDEEVMRAIAPIFAAFPNAKVTDEMLAVYRLMLRDLNPDLLARSVLSALAVCKFAPTIADIREQAEAMRRPAGPHSEVDPMTLPDIPRKMFRLDDDEDRQQRLERLRQTRNWDKKYL